MNDFPPHERPTSAGEELARDQGLFRVVGVLSALAGVVLVMFFWQSWREEGESVGKPGSNTAANTPKPPQVLFTDITHAAGVDFVQVNGACGEKLLPETMGGGVAFFDYDTTTIPICCS